MRMQLMVKSLNKIFCIRRMENIYREQKNEWLMCNFLAIIWNQWLRSVQCTHTKYVHVFGFLIIGFFIHQQWAQLVWPWITMRSQLCSEFRFFFFSDVRMLNEGQNWYLQIVGKKFGWHEHSGREKERERITNWTTGKHVEHEIEIVYMYVWSWPYSHHLIGAGDKFYWKLKCRLNVLKMQLPFDLDYVLLCLVRLFRCYSQFLAFFWIHISILRDKIRV